LYHAFSRNSAKALETSVLVASLLLAILATYQSLLPADHFLNRYVGWRETRIATLGVGRDAPVRATATFSFITGYTDFLYFALLITLTLLKERRLSLWKPILLISLIFYQMILTGSRGVLVLSGMVAILFLILHTDSASQTRRTPFLWVLPASLGLIVLLIFSHPSALKGIRERWDLSDFRQRLQNIFLLPFKVAPSAGLFGFGPGSEHQSREFLLGRTGELSPLPPFYEEESARVVFELGAIGAILWYGFWTILLFQILSLLLFSFREKKGVSPILALSLFTLHLLMSGIVYKTATSYLWALLMGMTLGASSGDSTQPVRQEK
jgi:hypothetical protein